ncbi:MAG: DUF1566 domain-containing protein [Rikenellaceae bacterium]|nr:DUF1566 domain-containing protein [Rikenellaceae bacterium]
MIAEAACKMRLLAASAVMALVFGGCEKEPSDLGAGRSDVPEGYAELRLTVSGAQAFQTKAVGPDIMDRIDNVTVFFFTDMGTAVPGGMAGRIDDADPVQSRNYYEYGSRQRIFLKSGETHWIYAVANLDESNIPDGGSADAFFDDVATWGDLKAKYILHANRTPQEAGKIVMSTDGIERIVLPGGGAAVPDVELHRLYSRFSVVIYNRTDGPGSRRNVSGAIPVSIAGIDFPKGSFLVERAAPAGDLADAPPSETGYAGAAYYQTLSQSVAPDGSEPVVEYPAGSGRWYTQQQYEFYCFENRRGNADDMPVNDLNDYDPDGPGGLPGGNPNVYERYAKALADASHIRISSLISNDPSLPIRDTMRGKALYTWIHAGKGRPEEAMPAQGDVINNFDVDRDCIYHFNVVINGINDIRIDSRREYLDQMVLFELANVAQRQYATQGGARVIAHRGRVDAHYVDLPAYLSGTAEGLVRLQSGTAGLDTYGNALGATWRPMRDDEPDADKWLRFSMHESEPGGTAVPVTWYTPEASTTLDVDMPGDGSGIKQRVILHFNENVSAVTGTGAVPARIEGTGRSVDPPFRTAVIRVGFADRAHTSAEYDRAEADGDVSYFYVPVEQYGLKTIGQMGGYDGRQYVSLLGIESVEEMRAPYYDQDGLVPPPYDAARGYVFWQYRNGGSNLAYNHTYDGLGATAGLYGDYTGNGSVVPPRRGEPNRAPAAGLYNPFSNTNAADYCMRKNRDENGDGLITRDALMPDGSRVDEVKWYLPTPVQMAALSLWRTAFDYPMNLGETPFPVNVGAEPPATSRYWTTTEVNAANAYATVFTADAFENTATAKTGGYMARCVRDIDSGSDQGLFYFSPDGQMVAQLDDAGYPHLPGQVYEKVGANANSQLPTMPYNTVANRFVISRWYVSGNGNVPSPTNGNAAVNACENYAEPGYPGHTWYVPSQQELTFMFMFAGVIEGVLEDALGPQARNAAGVQTDWDADRNGFHYFVRDNHWAVTDIGSQSTYWRVNFGSGEASTLPKNNPHYLRCVTYVTEANLPSRPSGN